MKLTSMK